MSGLEILSSPQEGFITLVSSGGWRVACLNGPQVYQRKGISSLSRHLQTDEVFILVKGSCLLVTAGNGADPGELSKTWMETGQLYNVTKAAWHGHILLPGATVMIVENRDTGTENSESRPIPETISL